MMFKHFFAATLSIVALLSVTETKAATIGSDGGITLTLSYSGLLEDPVTDNAGTVWDPGSDKLESDLEQFAEHVWQMSEEKHYIRRIIITDNKRSWETADIRWSVFDNSGVSNAHIGGWDSPALRIFIRKSIGTAIHQVVAHEFGHYFYGLWDEYETIYASGPDYYQGIFDGDTSSFSMTIDTGDNNTIMAYNNPWQFCDGSNHSLDITYTYGGNVISETLTPSLLTDSDTSNDGPFRAGTDHLYADDGWTVVCRNHVDLCNHHTDGTYPTPDFSTMLAVEFVYTSTDDENFPGTILLMDRSGSMSVEEYSRPASEYVQETAMFLYHTAETNDYIGAYAYNGATDEVVAYDTYDSAGFTGFLPPSGSTNIHDAIKTGIDALELEHGVDNVIGAQMILLSDGKHTTTEDFWTQVDRAEDRGIIIHTMAYGDANQAVLQQISDQTGGNDTLMSEANGGLSTLKMEMINKIARSTGYTPVHIQRGTLPVDGTGISGELYSEINFKVPHDSQKVSFYIFPESQGNPGVSFTVTDKYGNQNNSSYTQVQGDGRFVGLNMNTSTTGNYSVQITENTPPILLSVIGDPTLYSAEEDFIGQDSFYVVALVKNGQISADTWMDTPVIESATENNFNIYAKVEDVYDLTNVTVTAYFTAQEHCCPKQHKSLLSRRAVTEFSVV